MCGRGRVDSIHIPDKVLGRALSSSRFGCLSPRREWRKCFRRGNVAPIKGVQWRGVKGGRWLQGLKGEGGLLDIWIWRNSICCVLHGGAVTWLRKRFWQRIERQRIFAFWFVFCLQWIDEHTTLQGSHPTLAISMASLFQFPYLIGVFDSQFAQK